MTIAPPLIILFYIVRSDKFKEPTGMIIKSFIIGILLCFPAGILNELLIFSNKDPSSVSYIAGFTEETLKFLALYFYIRKQSHFNEPMDGIVYGALISLGFASLENYEYVYLTEYDNSMKIAIIRSVTAIPLHAFCGITMGFYFGLHFFSEKKKSYLLKSLFVPMIIHATYNFFVGFSLLLGIGLVIIVFFNTKRLHSELKQKQFDKKIEKEVKLKGDDSEKIYGKSYLNQEIAETSFGDEKIQNTSTDNIEEIEEELFKIEDMFKKEVITKKERDLMRKKILKI